MGVKNAYFPIFITEESLNTEKDHVEGFAAEVSVRHDCCPAAAFASRLLRVVSSDAEEHVGPQETNQGNASGSQAFQLDAIVHKSAACVGLHCACPAKKCLQLIELG